jgi:hypothetical protein
MLRFIHINGANLAYKITSNETNKPLFVTLHGGRGFGMEFVIQCTIAH